MYQVGNYIIYGTSGVCRIAAIGRPDASYADPNKSYYTLVPAYGTEVIYTPVDTKVFMRPVISKSEAEQLIREIPSIREDSAGNPGAKNQQILSEHYQSAIQTHDCGDLIRLIKTIYQKNQAAEKHGKKPGRIDEHYRKRAEELLCGELAIALGIPRDAVLRHILDALGPNAPECARQASKSA
ncbi:MULTISPECIES: CarD family transcriptional regulator [Anaerotruncus]|jgi:CarD family transcriptional regulator|uniref:CarD family transcriptional regulator n=1 Tax=Anaerotruncus TaxID=244127 RepID=UPI000829758B|nr:MULTISPECIES: CarD family transcriptional regulator [Anaerotruncus]RGX54813.1 hypothetical protein DWV16_12145 [Anaerotruncus sp. AF02-27]